MKYLERRNATILPRCLVSEINIPSAFPVNEASWGNLITMKNMSLICVSNQAGKALLIKEIFLNFIRYNKTTG